MNDREWEKEQKKYIKLPSSGDDMYMHVGTRQYNRVLLCCVFFEPIDMREAGLVKRSIRLLETSI